MSEETTRQSRYKIVQSADKRSFTVHGRTPVTVRLDTYKIIVEEPRKYHQNIECGLFEFRKMLSGCVEIIMSEWVGKPSEKKLKSLGAEMFVSAKVKTWAKTQCAKAIAKRVKQVWLDMLSVADPLVVAVQKKCFSVLGKGNEQLLQEDLYRQEFYVKDILNFRAAALTIPLTCFESGYAGKFIGWGMDGHNDPIFGGADNNFFDSYDTYRPRYTYFDNWMKCYSWNGEEPNTSLRRTLAQLPGNVPFSKVRQFRTVEFIRPVTDRLELLTTIFPAYRHRNILKMATHDEIKRAIQKVCAHRREKPNFRKSWGIDDYLQFIVDYPEGHNGRLVGLSQKSIDWHREGAYRNARAYCKYADNKQTALPPIPLPEKDGIRFLKSVDDVIVRGVEEGHCVGSYASKAVEGHCYLFAVDYKDESATVEVDRFGRVGQAQGKKNQKNKACEWATRILNNWGKKFPHSVYNESVYKYQDNIFDQPVLAEEPIPF